METHDELVHWERFASLVRRDPGLHGQLRATRDEDAFIALAVSLGAERGCRFTAQTVAAAIRQQRRAWLERWL